MDLLRILITLFLFLFSTLIQAEPNNKHNPGIAFIHGTKDHREDAYGGYWKADFIERCHQALIKSRKSLCRAL